MQQHQEIQSHRFNALRLLKQARYKECVDIAKNYPDDNFLSICSIRAQSNQAYIPNHLLTYQQLDITDSNMQNTAIVDRKTGLKALSARSKTMAGRLSTTRQVLTRQGGGDTSLGTRSHLQTRHTATALARQTATRMKTSKVRSQFDSSVHTGLLEDYPELIFDYQLHKQQAFRKCLDIASNYHTKDKWWKIQISKIQLIRGEPKEAYSTLKSIKALDKHSEAEELELILSQKLGLSIDMQQKLSSLDMLSLCAQIYQDSCPSYIYTSILKHDNTHIIGLVGLARYHIWKLPELSLLLLSRAFKLYGHENQISTLTGLAAFNSNHLHLVGAPLKKALLEASASGVTDDLEIIGWIFMMCGDFERASKCYNLAGISYSSAACTNNRAVVEKLLGNDQRAESILANAKSFMDNSPAQMDIILENLFYCSFKRKDSRTCHQILGWVSDVTLKKTLSKQLE